MKKVLHHILSLKALSAIGTLISSFAFYITIHTYYYPRHKQSQLKFIEQNITQNYDIHMDKLCVYCVLEGISI